ncbi:uncharacterized protein LOC142350866 [Convolutriloba macropyga]|uniref:uncharacterized protein LOC142350866 n=1 Tax=Convolutriloba macropyga TaxID=536237 RepID=UPI003F5234A2
MSKAEKNKILWTLFRSPPTEHQTAKFIFGFIFGFFMGLFIYTILISTMNWGGLDDKKNVLVLQFAILVGVITGMSTRWRCIFSLMLPSLVLGKGAVSFLVAYETILVTEGPVANIVYNAEQVMEAIECCSEMMAGNYEQVQKIVIRPVNETVQGILDSKSEVAELGKNFTEKYNSIDSDIMALIEAASDLDKREQDLNQTLAEIPAHCEEQFSINSASFNSCVDAKSREARSELLDYKLLLERAKQPNDTDAKRQLLLEYKTKSSEVCSEFRQTAKGGCESAIEETVVGKCKKVIGKIAGVCKHAGKGLKYSCKLAENLIECPHPPLLTDETIESYLESRSALNTIGQQFNFSVKKDF